MDEGEDAPTALARELEEELTLTDGKVRELGKALPSDRPNILTTVSLVDIQSEQPLRLGEGQSMRWYLPHEIEAMSLRPFHKQVLRYFLRGKR